MIIRLFFIALLAVACGSDVKYIGVPGPKGDQGSSGQSGKNVVASHVTVKDIDRSLAWDSFNVELSSNGIMMLPGNFKLEALTNTENGGWIDFYIGDQTYCYQGVVGKKEYNFKYKKTAGHVDGCDANNEKETNAVSLTVEFSSGDEFGLVPRAPRLNGIVFDYVQPVFYTE